jgi:hypothetical protein
MSADNNEPAFPIRGSAAEHQFCGLSMRDYFAAKVMPTCYVEACREFEAQGCPEGWRDGVALEAYWMADAMLKAREAP